MMHTPVKGRPYPAELIVQIFVSLEKENKMKKDKKVSRKESEEYLPGYPEYASSEDIYNSEEEEQEVNPESPEKLKKKKVVTSKAMKRISKMWKREAISMYLAPKGTRMMIWAMRMKKTIITVWVETGMMTWKMTGVIEG